MKKATKDHERVTPEGRAAGFQLCRFTEPVIAHLERQGEPDERCKTCAFRYGTVPNCCAETISDVIKAVVEDVPFMCHQRPRHICHGWFAARWAAGGRKGSVPWDFSPPDKPEQQPGQEPAR